MTENIQQIENLDTESSKVSLEERLGLLSAVQKFIKDKGSVDKIRQSYLSEIYWYYCGETNLVGAERARLRPVIEEIFEQEMIKN